MALGRALGAAELAAYDVIPRRLARRARIVTVRLLPRGARGMTLGRHIFVLRDDQQDGDSQLLAHELVHVGQWADLGLIRFTIRYLTDYFRHLPRLRSHRKAYLSIALEVHAYRRATEWVTAPDHPAPDHPAPDHPAPDHPAPDHPAPEQPARKGPVSDPDV